ncbi:MAG: DUF3025 domain-containing protein [Usitatibacteraceae bacterium]
MELDWASGKRQFFTPPFDSIRAPLAQLVGDESWPSIARLNQFAAGVANFRGKPIRFVLSDAPSGAPAPRYEHYEMRIAESGEIATRENWHDFFNAMSWLAFPEAKSAISETHARLLSARGEQEIRARSTPRDVLTLFDEGGIVVASSDASLLELIRAFEWKALFVDRRAEVETKMRFYLFGHSMLEKALQPYVGVTAKAILFDVDDAFLRIDRAAQLRQIDRRAAAWLTDESNLSSSKHFSPLPWLGVPGWWEANASPQFYDDAHYFRRGRMRDAKLTGQDELA